MENTLVILFWICTVIQIFFLVGIFSRLINFKNTEEISRQAVSVVVCAHNEYKNLVLLLPKLLSQQHADFEIILANDRSTDETETYIQSIQSQNFKFFTINATPAGWNSKKYALQMAVEQAKNPLILLTDADCIPSGKKWITKMTSIIFTEQVASIGYSPYQQDTTLLNKIIRFETMYTAIQYFSFALVGIPYMGVGRNMAYKKVEFINVGGLHSIKNLNGGDDDLLAAKIFKKDKVSIQLDEESFTYSIPEKSYMQYFIQKRRHLQAGKNYKIIIKLILGLLFGSQALFYILSVTTLIFNSASWISFILIIFRTSLLIYIFAKLSDRLKENFAWYWLPVLDFLYTMNYIIIGLSTYYFNKNQWK